jgi:hypothetical protein
MKRILLADYFYFKNYSQMPEWLFNELELAYLSGMDHVLVTPIEMRLLIKYTDGGTNSNS